jgi:hypothetical protein
MHLIVSMLCACKHTHTHTQTNTNVFSLTPCRISFFFLLPPLFFFAGAWQCLLGFGFFFFYNSEAVGGASSRYCCFSSIKTTIRTNEKKAGELPERRRCSSSRSGDDGTLRASRQCSSGVDMVAFSPINSTVGRGFTLPGLSSFRFILTVLPITLCRRRTSRSTFAHLPSSFRLLIFFFFSLKLHLRASSSCNRKRESHEPHCDRLIHLFIEFSSALHSHLLTRWWRRSMWESLRLDAFF